MTAPPSYAPKGLTAEQKGFCFRRAAQRAYRLPPTEAAPKL